MRATLEYHNFVVRYVLLAVREAPAILPDPKDIRFCTKIKTVRDAISHFPQLSAGESCNNVPNHYASRLSPLNIERIRATPHNGGDRRDWPKGLVLRCHEPHLSGYTDVYGRMWWSRAAPTLTSRCNSLSNGRFGHPEQDRAISLREAACPPIVSR